MSGLLERLINKGGGYDRVKGEMDLRAMVLLASQQFPWTIWWLVHCENFGVDETESSSREFCLLSSNTSVIQGDERTENTMQKCWPRTGDDLGGLPRAGDISTGLQESEQRKAQEGRKGLPSGALESNG